MFLHPHDDPTQSDVWHLDGLRTTLHHILLYRLEGKDIQRKGGLHAEVYKRVRAIIGAPKTFKKPPSLEKRPTECAKVNFKWFEMLYFLLLGLSLMYLLIKLYFYRILADVWSCLDVYKTTERVPILQVSAGFFVTSSSLREQT